MKRFKMAYVVLCHKNPQQINLLLESLKDEHVEFFLHVDAESGIEHEIRHRPDIHFVREPVVVQWGHYSQIESVLKCFKLIRETDAYDYVHLISGQDLPLVPNRTIAEFFKAAEGKEFVKHVKLPNSTEMWGCLYRVSVYYPRFLISKDRRITRLRDRYTNVVMRVPFLRRKLDALPAELYKGSNWMSITGACMEYILDYIGGNPDYDRLFRHSFCGDEVYFHTLILNSPYRENVVNEIKRYTDWDTGPDYPRTLRLEDYSRIREKGQGCFWGRKFDLDVDREIIDHLLLEA
ncbi:beta-1,6-N-acetylglucosaminyltransferase [Paenibacillus glufosinatiresistens]|uniref:beta-1,6-N-acetylglucosaminyltransferase n=1 Tax=Paenibacillus glufosinatiresistens TaxID=3070657 RepID=UPI00286E8EB9|nr:beta-1,6-N-acetylglucosaminyltransferase [Paenibacillus sp. YX.27]